MTDLYLNAMAVVCGALIGATAIYTHAWVKILMGWV